MKILYLDCFSGISGDMFLAACLDAGIIKESLLERKLSTLSLGKVKIITRRVKRNSIAVTRISFQTARRKKAPEHRSFRNIRQLIAKSDLTADEQQRSIAIFHSLAKAEAKIHNTSLHKVHFHELGAVDSILDIVGAAVVIEHSGITRSFVSKINLGSGFIKTEHGPLPVPAPATLELLKGLPVYSSGIEAELVTPTGAAIVKHLAPECGLPPARWETIGYGAGTRDLKEQPNVLRVLIGESIPTTQSTAHEEAVVIETDIDDMNPQLLPHVQELLFQQGAQDVSWHSLHMKKNRPGVRLYVMSPPEHVDALCETVFRETTTLGVRINAVEKRRLERKMMEVEIPQGRVRVKVGLWQERVMNLAPEYEDCVRLARQSNVPVKEIMRLSLESAHRKLKP